NKRAVMPSSTLPSRIRTAVVRRTARQTVSVPSSRRKLLRRQRQQLQRCRGRLHASSPRRRPYLLLRCNNAESNTTAV
ncbi:hypothetical protein E4U16_000897, partial [Claviceps sp. LM84 group G4]